MQSAIFILLDPSLADSYHGYANELLEVFVNNYSAIYGQEHVVYNVHNLLHIADDAEKFGHLDSCSAFPFENFMQKIKKLVRKPEYPLQQVVYRLKEMKNSGYYSSLGQSCFDQSDKPTLCNRHEDGPIPNGVGHVQQFKKLEMKTGLVLSTLSRDNCVTILNRVCILKNILFAHSSNSVQLVVRMFNEQSDFYKYPLNSSMLGICSVSQLGDDLHVIPLSSVQSKNVRLSLSSYDVVIPLH